MYCFCHIRKIGHSWCKKKVSYHNFNYNKTFPYPKKIFSPNNEMFRTRTFPGQKKGYRRVIFWHKKTIEDQTYAMRPWATSVSWGHHLVDSLVWRARPRGSLASSLASQLPSQLLSQLLSTSAPYVCLLTVGIQWSLNQTIRQLGIFKTFLLFRLRSISRAMIK